MILGNLHRTSQVFIPGGMPKLTYVPRSQRNLEERLRATTDNLCKLVTITGSTKSGKTVLANTIFPRTDSIWVDGGTVKEEEDLWNYILEGLDGYTGLSNLTSKSNTTSLDGEVEGTANLPLFASAKAKGSLGHERSKEKTKEQSRTLTPRSAAISQLRDQNIPLIIDDFHYLDRKFQGSIVRALKPLIFEGLPVVLIAIPHRRYDVVKVEREMTGRLESIDIPSWEQQELLEIARTGFPLLNLEVKENVCNSFANESYGSPHLMQQFCKDLALINGIEETPFNPYKITSIDRNLFHKVAEGTGKVIFDRLAKGPRQRSDRMQRQLSSGDTADIYKVTLFALAKLGPGLDTVEYEQLRAAMKEVLNDPPPQAHEVTRVFEKMAEIAANDEASISVLDWEKEEQRLHITDPFFAFYLKWGIQI